ncbi:uncharacterized protein N7515_003233 [Penicillium bovifimosum]|uniref:Uncharacterized protein n=1 Tax=Penicillium bovifimosum TaxID=126998 RepID=A0A9W9H4A0_9EURO|nr:uncharacterized protein N7515_003233 [Penicillium bovifimosum]KAJ5138385.1 hypothetical protein N7515_003233 [Penicillium bovifimosum]
MNQNTYSAANDIWHSQLLDSPLCHKCLELHDHHACTTPLSKPLSADAISLPPRSIRSGITGALSLHDYRKFLSKSADRVGDRADHASRKLKRKTAALHLNRPPALSISYPVSVSSATSSPPPLSPSYSQSIVSQRSEEPEIAEAQPAHSQYNQDPRATVADIGRGRVNRKRLNTFREKLQKRTEAKVEADRAAKPPDTDSMLAHTQAVATVSHGGACFEILNPRKSLDLARIVSYIEDVDNCSMVSVDHRDSAFSLEQGLDRVSLSQLTDASLPSFYSTNSLYTSLPADPPTPKAQSTDIPSSSPRIRERIRSLSDYSLTDQAFNYWSRPVQNEPTIHEPNHQHSFSERDAPHAHLTSIREEPRPPALDLSLDNSRPSTPSTRTFYSDSEIGEPGSPVYANGDWAQVDDRDRGIFYEQPEYEDEDITPSAQEYTPYPHNLDQEHLQNQHRHQQIHRTQTPETNPEPPTPRETPLDTPLTSPMHSPMYSSFDSAYPYPSTPSTSKLPHYPPLDPYTYDPVYFDPHVQSVLAAANAETMGLRGTPARALEELQRGRGDARFEFPRGKSHERKSVQRKGLKKFFSWRSGN